MNREERQEGGRNERGEHRASDAGFGPRSQPRNSDQGLSGQAYGGQTGGYGGTAGGYSSSGWYGGTGGYPGQGYGSAGFGSQGTGGQGYGSYSSQGYGAGYGGYATQGYTAGPGNHGHSGQPHSGGYGPGQSGAQAGQGGWGQQQAAYGGSPGYGQGYGPQARPGQPPWDQYGTQPSGGQRQRRGPKGYERSDSRLREEVCERIVQSPEIDASDVEIDVNEGVVTLKGTVESRQSKHRIEDVADSVWGVKDVHNEIRVRSGGAAAERMGGDSARHVGDR